MASGSSAELSRATVRRERSEFDGNAASRRRVWAPKSRSFLDATELVTPWRRRRDGERLDFLGESVIVDACIEGHGASWGDDGHGSVHARVRRQNGAEWNDPGSGEQDEELCRSASHQVMAVPGSVVGVRE